MFSLVLVVPCCPHHCWDAGRFQAIASPVDFPCFSSFPVCRLSADGSFPDPAAASENSAVLLGIAVDWGSVGSDRSALAEAHDVEKELGRNVILTTNQ